MSKNGTTDSAGSTRCCSNEDWTFHLKTTRTNRDRLLSTTIDCDSTSDKDKNNLNEWNDNNSFYIHFLSLKFMIRDELQMSLTLPTSTTMKHIRTVLRVALSCLSISPSKSTKNSNNRHQYEFIQQLRTRIQNEAYDAWRDVLLHIVQQTVMTADPQCRILAAQVLCNCITNCYYTAYHFITRIVQPAPSETNIKDQLSQQIIAQPQVDNSAALDGLSTGTATTTSWVELILNCSSSSSSSSSRSLLAIVVATLHNCICSVTIGKSARESEEEKEKGYQLYQTIASSTLLISTLLRYTVSTCCTIQEQEQQNQLQTSSHTNVVDDATEWIQLTISKLCCLGMLPQMYLSIAGNGSVNISTVVYPEHIVLLHLVRNIVEESIDLTSADNSDTNNDDDGNDAYYRSKCYRLGGEGYNNSKENEQRQQQIQNKILDVHIFLTTLYTQLRDALFLESTDDDSRCLQVSAQQLVLDILAETLSDDNPTSSRIRSVLGTDTLILQSIVTDLAVILDDWYAVNQSSYTRDQTKMNDVDQCRLTTSVRVIGNLCFHCSHNQHLLRITNVPYKNKNHRTTELERNGLHVLLSTTSMSYVCFTLREWAVVAIRMTLEDCVENQAVVAELEAQASVHTADHEEMGIRVNLNVANGTVTVNPSGETNPNNT